MIVPVDEEDMMGDGEEGPTGLHRLVGDGVRFRTGDVLTLECPLTETTVASVSRFYVSVRWPWNDVDPEAHSFRWNGETALPTPESFDWDRTYFRTVPAETDLKAGDTCLVGIPPTVVHVASVHEFDPPLVTGMLPRPACYLEVLRQGEAHDPELEDQGCALDPVGGEPIRIELLFRPYAFLEVGDEIVDHDGRAWRFDGPWDWHSFDARKPTVPAWPLELLSRNGDPAPEDTAAVAQQTGTGSHEEELRRWTRLALGRPSTGQP
ncbi:hypothetical protein ACFV14_37045 [Streptomyces zaomyceticus]|uniref:hypothetical protein n=1 Tax=Streptomyces zaomyceticus TaxID=68286 RepID=UPI0036BEBF89